LADKQKFLELREQRKLLKIANMDAKRKLVTSNLSSREEEVKAMSPTNLLVQGSKDQLKLHHQLTGTYL
jgi:hypothetical protein